MRGNNSSSSSNAGDCNVPTRLWCSLRDCQSATESAMEWHSSADSADRHPHSPSLSLFLPLSAGTRQPALLLLLYTLWLYHRRPSCRTAASNFQSSNRWRHRSTDWLQLQQQQQQQLRSTQRGTLNYALCLSLSRKQISGPNVTREKSEIGSKWKQDTHTDPTATDVSFRLLFIQWQWSEHLSAPAVISKPLVLCLLSLSSYRLWFFAPSLVFLPSLFLRCHSGHHSDIVVSLFSVGKQYCAEQHLPLSGSFLHWIHCKLSCRCHCSSTDHHYDW